MNHQRLNKAWGSSIHNIKVGAMYHQPLQSLLEANSTISGDTSLLLQQNRM